jgi:phage shock protein PspC (stress-responsive transcriptional regulator)
VVSAAPVVERPALRRRTEDRLVAGVGGGVADWLNAPVGFVRLLLLAGGTWEPLVLAYAAAALVIPARGHNRPGWDNLVAVGRLALVIVGIRLVFGTSQDVTDLSDQSLTVWIGLFALGLVGALVLLSSDYVRERPRSDAETRDVVLEAAPLTIFIVVFIAAVTLLPGPRWDHYAPLGVLVAGVSLLFWTLRGRKRPLAAPVVVAVVLATTVVASGARLQGGVGDVELTAADIHDSSLVVRRANGDVTVDLRGSKPVAPVTVRASVGIGDLKVLVPARTPLDVSARLGRGTIETELGRSYDSTSGFDRRLVREYSFGDRPEIRVVAEVGTGRIQLGSGHVVFASAGVR